MNEVLKCDKDGMIFHTPSANYLDNGTMRRTLKCLSEIITSEDIFIDVGSHIGCVFVQTVKERNPFRSFAFEPTKDVFECLKRNCKENALKDYELFNAAVSDHTGDGGMYYADWGSPSNSLVDRFEGRLQKTPVKLICLNSLEVLNLPENKERKIVLKIDAECSEPEVWKGMSELFPRVKAICMELFLKAFAEAKIDFKPLLQSILDAGFTFFTLEGEELKYEQIIGEPIIDVLIKPK